MVQTEREYAEALFAVALEENAVNEYLQALECVKQLVQDNPDYIEFLASPAIALSERTGAVEEAFGGRMPEYTVSFLKLLCENGRIRTLFDCVDEFSKLAMAFSNRAAAQIYSAVPLSEEQKKSVCARLERLTQKSVDPVYIIDESLIGGLKIEVDGKTFDGSIRRRLGEIKDVMNS